MAINFQNALGIHEQALTVRTRRAEVISNNLANVDTPNFKARDVDFRAMLTQQLDALEQPSLQLNTTSTQHNAGFGGESDAGLLYRTPQQPSIDGNTVEAHQEQAEFMKNALDFQASFRFINGKFKSLSSAIKGE